MDPFSGCWQNASAEKPSRMDFDFAALKAPVTVVFDSQMVPHIFAKNRKDVFFMQGYMHAYHRLWQMDMTTRLASGRLSEVAGEATLDVDRKMRRLGMVYAAEKSTRAMEQDPQTADCLQSYTQGVNEFIAQLSYRKYPLEYKLMNFMPEPWTPLKTGLMLKFMADKLSGHTEDFELTLAQHLFSEDFNLLYPERLKEEYPIITDPYVKRVDQGPIMDSAATSFNFSGRNDGHPGHSETGIGSNNWVLSGKKTQSGKPILCNDPHLPLNLPAIWYQNQLVTPDMNVYGVSLPGAPAIVIGFTDSTAWGFTNGYRDVKDFYALKYTDSNKTQILVGTKTETLSAKVETINIKGKAPYLDTVWYSSLGPVMYDDRFPREGAEGTDFAVKWMAHRGTNELKALLGLNSAKNYSDYVKAIAHFECPHQNIAFASASGDIALWSQGRFIQKEPPQGRFILHSENVKDLWGSDIDQAENPHQLNPDIGFVYSANQINTGPNYRYYYTGIFTEERAKRIDHLLRDTSLFTVDHMKAMQQDDYGQNAADLLPFMLSQIDSRSLTAQEKSIYTALSKWNYHYQATSPTPSYYEKWFEVLEQNLYDDEFKGYGHLLNYPRERQTIDLLKDPSPFRFIDNISTPQVESRSDLIRHSFLNMCTHFKSEPTPWYRYKNTTANHLTKIPAFSFSNIMINGGHGCINAASSANGPSWRMIVHFTQPIEAWGIYAGGQNGDPGSVHYSDQLADWANGNYYRIIFAHQPEDIILPK